ncbi:MAG: Hsp20/alpha crystallin family protein [Pseudomonadota bacterium]
MLYSAPMYLRRDPFALMRRMMQGHDRAFVTRGAAPAFPALNVWQNAETAAVTAELPGVEPSDIEMTVKDNVITLSGERKAPEVAQGTTWHRRERGYGKFTRTIHLPFEADTDKVEARFRNGVLQIVVGRAEKDKPRQIKIEAA